MDKLIPKRARRLSSPRKWQRPFPVWCAMLPLSLTSYSNRPKRGESKLPMP